MTFSEKYGFKPVRTVMQSDSMDEPLKNGLWNELYNYYFHRFTRQLPIKQMGYNDSNLIWQIWKDYYKLPVDNIPYYSDKILTIVKSRYFNSKWNEIYDFVLFCSTVFDDAKCNSEFRKDCNRILERELSGYRFVDNEIAPITSAGEIAEIEKATATNDPVATHLKTALNHLSDKESHDYRNSIKESISAVESICGIIADKPKATLGDALAVIRKNGTIELHPALNAAFDKLYGYTSDANGIRHALLDETDLKQEDAVFMLVACSAFANYLKVKMSRIA